MHLNARADVPSATPETHVTVLLAFEEALARTADQIGAHTKDLSTIPLLFSRSGSFEKRMSDVLAGKKENVNLPSRLKRFMKERYPEYRFDVAGPDQLWFRKKMTPTLDALLMFEKIHHHGLGKSFTLEFAIDFPGTPFEGIHRGRGGTRKNIFWLFHEGWEKRVWAYTTSAELATALEGFEELLLGILPTAEEQCRNLLLPPPTTLPAGIVNRGALSARQAYELVLPIAHAWSTDAELQSIGSSYCLGPRDGIGGSSIGEDGRLRPPGSWTIKFVSKSIDRYCCYTVPHMGRVWWNYYPVSGAAIPKYSAVLESDDWLDSTVVAEHVFKLVQKQLSDFSNYGISLVMHDPKRYTGNFLWEAHCIFFGPSVSDRHDIRVQLDLRTGNFLENI